jgi:hypothetical protein
MKRPRRNHSPAFKVKVAFEALKGGKTFAQATETPAAAWRLQTCQPGPASSRSAKNAPTALSA